jgi:hypothetical protein
MPERSSPSRSNPPPEPQPLQRVVLGQLAGAGGVVLLAGVQADWGLSLLAHPDYLLAAGLVVWPLAAVAAGWSCLRQLPGRPLRPLLVGLLPAGLAALLAELTSGNLGLLALGGDCAPWAMARFAAERLRVVGLLASGAIWIGCLPALLGSATPAAGRPRWVLPAAGLLWLGAAVWSLLDPLLPAVASVGGPAVRGLWPLALALPAGWIWLQGLSAAGDAAAERGLAWGLAAWGGLCAWGVGFWLVHRAAGLERLAEWIAAGEPAAWPAWFGAGLSLAACMLRLLPLAAAALLLAGWVCGRRLDRAGRSRALALLAGLAVLGLIGLAAEGRLRDGFSAACRLGPAAEGLCAAERRVVGICASAVVPEQGTGVAPEKVKKTGG